ncbi:MAG: hypothetical protein J5737_02100 [Bacteroidales bacterium]|nr:hypothetical protein [Bacteroidales bacterium]
MRYKGIIFILCALLCASCTKSTHLESFLSDSTVRLEIDGEPVFIFSPATCQLSYNEQRKEFRAMTDTMLDYFCVTLSAIPAGEGKKATAAIAWSTPGGERSRNDVTLEAKRIKGDVIWLCDDSRHTAVVVTVLK